MQIFVFMSQLLDSPGTLLMWINLVKTHNKLSVLLLRRSGQQVDTSSGEYTVNFQIEALLCTLILNCVNTFVEDWLNMKISAIEIQVLHFLKEKH